MELSEKDEEYISSLLKQGKKVEAIAFIKNKTGMSLIEAKDYIDKKNISISEEDEQYLSSLINENKELEAVIFLHKNKDMSLLEAKNYTDRLILKKNIETNKKSSRKWGYVYDEDLNTFVPNLARQKKAIKIMLNIFLVLLVITLIQFIFLDRSSDIKMIIFKFSISGILVLIITLPLGSLSIHYIENKLKKLKNLELSNQFEVKAFISNFEIFLHGEKPRSQLIKEFKEAKNPVLFGTTSFWEGVDVQGENLSNVIITKLPFLVPTDPIVSAISKKIEEDGGNSFSDFQLPEAIIKFKQGVGRLIRKKTDRGNVFILDSRIIKKRYGSAFIKALPSQKNIKILA
mgnify:CR=1 FL=1